MTHMKLLRDGARETRILTETTLIEGEDDGPGRRTRGEDPFE